MEGQNGVGTHKAGKERKGNNVGYTGSGSLTVI
jgi:hypothetical protein